MRPNPVQRHYMHAVIDAATRDATVARVLDRVAALTASCSSLLRPAIAARVLARRRSTPHPAPEPTLSRPKKELVGP